MQAVVGPNQWIRVSLEMRNAGGERVAEVPEDDPLGYVHGYGVLLPGLEAKLTGLSAGAEQTFVLTPEEAFGVRDEDGLFQVPRDEFPDDEDGAEPLAPGDEYIGEGPDGLVRMQIVEVTDDVVVVDANHPLAGETLTCLVKIHEVRSASDAEIDEAQQKGLDGGHEDCDCGEDHPPAESLIQLSTNLRRK